MVICEKLEKTAPLLVSCGLRNLGSGWLASP